MPLQPRFQRRPGGELPGPRAFVDREELLAAFDAAVADTSFKGPRVLVYWGLAGIGKSRLKRELRERLTARDDGALWAEVDFALPTMRDPQTALFSLRRQLSERHSVAFPTFDLVYAYLWKLTRPNTAPVDEGKPLFEAGSMAASLLSSMGVPFVSLAANLVEKASGPLKAWWVKRGREDLKTISRLEAAEIEERLPAYFAEDLVEHRQGCPRVSVLFLDTYEALFADVRSEEQRLLRDEWVRELTLQLPFALCVVCGREKLDWEHLDPDWSEALEQHQLEGLPDEDARELLVSARVTDSALQDRITRETGNVPFLLDLALDTMEEIRRRGRDVGPEDFTGFEATAEARMAERFLRYLSPAEQDTVEVLSVPRLFDDQLFRDLCVSFNTQFPLGHFREICRFSFVLERSFGVYQMHDIMAESLRTRLARRDPERLRGIHSFLFQRFDAKLQAMGPHSVTPDHQHAFLDAYFHGRGCLSLPQMVDWFALRVKAFAEAGLDRPLQDAARALAADARESLGLLDITTVRALACLGELSLPDPKQSEAALRQALTGARAVDSFGEKLVPRILTHLGRTLFFGQNRYEEARPLLEEALSSHEVGPILDEVDYCLAAASLSACLDESGDCREAIEVCRRALSRVQEDPGNRYYLWLVNNYAYYQEGMGCYREADRIIADCYRLTVSRYTEENFNLGLPLSTWAEIRLDQRRYEEAYSLAGRGLSFLDLGEDPRTRAEMLSLLAETCAQSGRLEEARQRAEEGLQIAGTPRLQALLTAALARVSMEQGAYEECAGLLGRCLALARQVLREDHPWFSALYLLWGKLELLQARPNEAEERLQKALDVITARTRPEHPRAGEILLELAKLRRVQGRAEAANELESRGRDILEREGCLVP